MKAAHLLTPALYAAELSGGRFKVPRHIRYLDKIVTDVLTDKRPERIIIVEMPPRHGKSVFCSQWLPTWYLANFPGRRVMLNSYSATLSTNFSRTARDHLIAYGQAYGVKVREDVRAAARWEMESHGGGCMAAGVGGGITGFGADLAIIDDPLKNADDALSDTIRQKQVDWFTSTLWTRIEPGGVLLVIQTRWHKQDLAGYIYGQADELGVGVVRVTLPAIATSADDPLGRQPGEVLWPKRWPMEELRKKQTGESYWWQALYQQNPGEYGSTEWPASYFNDDIWVQSGQWPERFDVVVTALDPSKGKGNRSDYSAIVTVGLKDRRLWVDADLQRRPVETMVEDTLKAAARYQVSSIGIETNAFQELIAPIMRAKADELGYWPPSMAKYDNRVKKEIRIARLGAPLERGLFRFRNNRGTQLLVKQLREFPHGDHDDGPDGLEMATRLMRDVLAVKDRQRKDPENGEGGRWATSYAEIVNR